MERSRPWMNRHTKVEGRLHGMHLGEFLSLQVMFLSLSGFDVSVREVISIAGPFLYSVEARDRLCSKVAFHLNTQH
jgi:hypothetical protein